MNTSELLWRVAWLVVAAAIWLTVSDVRSQNAGPRGRRRPQNLAISDLSEIKVSLLSCNVRVATTPIGNGIEEVNVRDPCINYAVWLPRVAVRFFSTCGSKTPKRLIGGASCHFVPWQSKANQNRGKRLGRVRSQRTSELSQ